MLKRRRIHSSSTDSKPEWGNLKNQCFAEKNVFSGNLKNTHNKIRAATTCCHYDTVHSNKLVFGRQGCWYNSKKIYKNIFSLLAQILVSRLHLITKVSWRLMGKRKKVFLSKFKKEKDWIKFELELILALAGRKWVRVQSLFYDVMCVLCLLMENVFLFQTKMYKVSPNFFPTISESLGSILIIFKPVTHHKN